MVCRLGGQLEERGLAQDSAWQLGTHRHDRRTHSQLELKQIDEEEARTARLYAAGQISDEIWEGRWTEWQDRRQTLQCTLETMQQEHQVHIDNLDLALEIIAKIGTLYNGLQRGDQKELLRQVIERVIVDDDGQVNLELRSPFGYLNTLVDDIKREKPRLEKSVKHGRRTTKNAGEDSPAVSPEQCSSHVQLASADCIQSERHAQLSLAQFLSSIAYPKREQPLSCLI